MSVFSTSLTCPLARNQVNTELIANNWDDMLRVAGSLKLGTVSAS